MQTPTTFARSDDPPRHELPETWVDRYTAWASKQTDAPVQYHVVNAIAALSTIMCPYVVLETSFGVIKPNIWTMILAGTTVTRKSTSMDMALRMLHDVHPDFLMGTEGSPEGILSELSHRDGKVAVFHRDEITGWIESAIKRDYLSGLLETFTRLYDGKPEKRVLRKESSEVHDPNLVIVSGGIKNKMQEIITMEHIRSGFLPRFIMVTGTTTVDEQRPIGPPSKEAQLGRDPRELIVEELYKVVCHYTAQPSDEKVEINGIVKLAKGHATNYVLTASDETWHRIQLLKYDALKFGERSTNPEIYMPLYDRLTNSIIKVAMLLAGARQSLVIELSDICKAIYYADKWLQTVTEFAQALEVIPEMDKWERKMDRIFQFIKKKHPESVSRSEVMRQFRVKATEVNDMEKTLVARGQILVLQKEAKDNPAPGRKRTEYILSTRFQEIEDEAIVVAASAKESNTKRRGATTKASPSKM